MIPFVSAQSGGGNGGNSRLKRNAETEGGNGKLKGKVERKYYGKLYILQKNIIC